MIFKIILFLLLTPLSYAQINVVTSTTDLSWLVKEIGQEHVNVESLLSGAEDPHYVDAMPHFISKASDAKVFCFIGMDLEIGWIPKVLKRSGNTLIQPGGSGFCDSSKYVDPLDKVVGAIDRSQGDVHPAGNPHYHLSPSQFLLAGKSVLEALSNSDPSHKEAYYKNYEKLKKTLSSIRAEVFVLLKNVKGKKFLEYHREFTYFLDEYNLQNLGAIEDKPGVPPSAQRIGFVSLKAKKQRISLAIAAKTAPLKVLNRFSQISGVKTLSLPLSIQSDQTYNSYRDLQLYIASQLIKSL